MIHLIWTFRVFPDRKAEFVSHYRALGTWAKFFETGSGYRGTDLIYDRERDIYMTIDRWDRKEDYEAFKHANKERYNLLDKQFERLTLEENFIGCFQTIP